MDISMIPVLTIELFMETLYKIAHSPTLYLLVGLIVLDFLSGSCKAMVTGQFNSKAGINGLVKHMLVLVLVVFLKFFGRLFGLDVIVYTTSLMFSFNYLISIVENLEVMGIKLPTWVLNKLKQVQDKVDNEEEIVIDRENDEIIIRKSMSDVKGMDR